MPSAKPVRIFISSPGDVVPERRVAHDVIQRLDREFSARFRVEGIFWEQEQLVATEHFQAGITAPSKADIVVAILWSRLGQPLPRGDFAGPVTGRSVTGTEYEWEEAMSGWKKRGWPAVLFYRKMADAPVKVADPQRGRAVNDEIDKVDNFIARWFLDAATGTYKNAYREFTTPDELADLLYVQLVKLLKRRVGAPAGQAQEPAPVLAWHQGSPFRGLLGFSFEHSAIFFGRTRAALEAALERFRPPPRSLPRRLSRRGRLHGNRVPRRAETSPSGVRKLILICCRPPYVAQEIRLFATDKGAEHIIPVLLTGIPNQNSVPVPWHLEDHRRPFDRLLCTCQPFCEYLARYIDRNAFDQGKRKPGRGLIKAGMITIEHPSPLVCHNLVTPRMTKYD